VSGEASTLNTIAAYQRFAQVLVLEPDATNHDYRIMSAPMSETDANAACASVKQAGRSCTVVQATS
jgi:hypothetical protein